MGVGQLGELRQVRLQVVIHAAQRLEDGQARVPGGDARGPSAVAAHEQRLEEEGQETHCGRGQEEAGCDEHVATLGDPQGGTGAAGGRDGQLAVTPQ